MKIIVKQCVDHKTFEHVVFQGADLLWIFWKQHELYLHPKQDWLNWNRKIKHALECIGFSLEAFKLMKGWLLISVSIQVRLSSKKQQISHKLTLKCFLTIYYSKYIALSEVKSLNLHLKASYFIKNTPLDKFIPISLFP